MLTIQPPGIHSGQAIDVYGNSRRSIGHLSVSEALNATGPAEEMADRSFVEEILCEIVFAGFQPKVLRWREREDKA
jgi:hypothetical protein